MQPEYIKPHTPFSLSYPSFLLFVLTRHSVVCLMLDFHARCQRIHSKNDEFVVELATKLLLGVKDIFYSKFKLLLLNIVIAPLFEA